jgi:DNA repair photolyase
MGSVRLSAGRRPQLALDLGSADGTPGVLDRRRRGATFVDLAARSALNSPATTGMAFWTLNPYVGCEFACSYCYARATHRWTSERTGLDQDGRMSPYEAFERNIFVKRGAARLLLRTLDPAKLDGLPLLIGTATDPYQPAERRFGVTRSVLEALLRFQGLEIWITTKSPLIARDVDLLAQVAGRHRLSVCISIITLDAELVRRLEPRSPLPRVRLRAMAKLAARGLPVGALIAPIGPGLTDGWGALGGLMAASKEAGARFAVGSALRLAPVARAGFLPVLEREFPELVARYHRRYGRSATAGKAYLTALDRRLRALQEIHGFARTSLRFGE